MEITFKETTFGNDNPPAIDETFLNNFQKTIKTDLTNINNELESKVNKESGKGLSQENFTTNFKEKLENISDYNELKNLLIKEEIISTENNLLSVKNTAEGLKAKVTEISSNKISQRTEPSITTESEIEGVTGNLIISSYNKNIYNPVNIYNKGDNVIVDEDDWISVNYDNSAGVATKFENFFTKLSNIIKPNKKYYLIVEVAEASGWGFINLVSAVQNNDKSQFLPITAIQINNLHAGDIILNEITSLSNVSNESANKLMRSYFQFDKNNVGSCKIRLSLLEEKPDTNNFVYIKNQGKELTIKLENKKLYGNELAKDSIVFKDNKWQYARNWNTVVLNGAEDWKQEVTSNAGYRYRLSLSTNSPLKNNNTINIKSSRLQGKSALDTWNGIDGISVGFHIQIYLEEYKNKTLDEFKQFLNENPITATYIVNDTTYEEIIDIELINELNKLLDIEQYEEETNMFFNQEVIFKTEVKKNRLSILNERIVNIENSLNTTE